MAKIWKGSQGAKETEIAKVRGHSGQSGEVSDQSRGRAMAGRAAKREIELKHEGVRRGATNGQEGSNLMSTRYLQRLKYLRRSR